jgi:hypothetical protein
MALFLGSAVFGRRTMGGTFSIGCVVREDRQCNFIEKFADLTEDVLLEHYPRFENALKEKGHHVHEMLTKDYWRDVIGQTPKEANHKFDLQDVIPRKRC